MNLKKNTALKFKKNKAHAFTLIEMMFSLFIFSLTMSIIPSLFNSVTKMNEQMNDTSLINYEFFAQDITRELNGVPYQTITITNRKIIVNDQGKQTAYIFNNHKVYKNINARGNITLIHNVKNFHVSKINDKYIKVELTLIENKEKYHKVLIL